MSERVLFVGLRGGRRPRAVSVRCPGALARAAPLAVGLSRGARAQETDGGRAEGTAAPVDPRAPEAAGPEAIGERDAAGPMVLPVQATVDVELAALALDRRLSARLVIESALDASALDAVGFALPGRCVHAAMEVWW
ncbi:uncharacterized protein SOCEGT47_061040 [Sorangium cellulosum]|uniref:Uncharacterized protein n=1 Tax=Sorangium cellulosum TaxID=56 RepID=A0A4P2Q8M1_SORCE|nr:hypothetical protein [Sorangium cellulosum]AUX25556.1 uncharacterized protein SOCEGT47_061040 [Sorangium cellulosum]